MRRHYIAAVVSVLMTGLLLFYSCASPASSQPRQVVTTVRRGDLITSVVAVGNLSLPRQMDLTFQVAGTLKEVRVKEGDLVKKGQVLALLDDTALKDAVTEKELALVQQEKALEAAKLDLRRATEQMEEISPKAANVYTYYTDIPAVQNNVALARGSIQSALESIGSGNSQEAKWALEEALKYLHIAYSAASTSQFIPVERQKPVSDAIVTLRQYTYQYEKSQAAYERAVLARDAAKLALEQAKKQLEKAILVAPYDGLIASVNAKEGANVGVNTVICKLVNTGQVEMKGFVDEGDVNKLKVGMEAVVTLDAMPGVELKGKLTFISPIATVQSGVVYYQVIVAVEPHRTVALRDGMTATANMVLERRSGVLLVSRRAIAGTPRERYVDVVVDEATGRTERRTVVTGMSDDDNVEIISGLKEGEKVLIVQTTATRSSMPSGMPPGMGMR